MLKRIYLLAILLLPTLAWAQPHLRVIASNPPYISFPSIVTVSNPGTNYSFDVVTINTGTATFTGTVDFLLKAGNGPIDTIALNVPITNLNPQTDTFPYVVLNYTPDPQHFLVPDDIVVIWPRVQGADSFQNNQILIDSFAQNIHVNFFTGIENVTNNHIVFDAGFNRIQLKSNLAINGGTFNLYNSIGQVIFTCKTDKEIQLPFSLSTGVYIAEVMQNPNRVVQKISIH
jgi:hypothetical protein